VRIALQSEPNCRSGRGSAPRRRRFECKCRDVPSTRMSGRNRQYNSNPIGRQVQVCHCRGVARAPGLNISTRGLQFDPNLPDLPRPAGSQEVRIALQFEPNCRSGRGSAPRRRRFECKCRDVPSTRMSGRNWQYNSNPIDAGRSARVRGPGIRF
jgi:hypothetical protein